VNFSTGGKTESEIEANVLSLEDIQVFITMAGLGERFKSAGFSTLKPLIEVDGRPMFMKAVESIHNLEIGNKINFVSLYEHEQNCSITAIIKANISQSEIFLLKENTKGPADTIFQVKNAVNIDKPLLILDCDIAFESQEFRAFLRKGKFAEYAGACLYFKSNDPSFSYIKIGTKRFISDIIEKKVISNSAVAGVYFFSKASDFFIAAEELLLQPQFRIKESEIFLSSIIKLLIQKKRNFLAIPTKFWNYGTPKDYFSNLKIKDGEIDF